MAIQERDLTMEVIQLKHKIDTMKIYNEKLQSLLSSGRPKQQYDSVHFTSQTTEMHTEVSKRLLHESDKVTKYTQKMQQSLNSLLQQLLEDSSLPLDQRAVQQILVQIESATFAED